MDMFGILDKGFQNVGGKTHTQAPTCTGASVVAIKFNDGIVMAADTQVSYGSMARYFNVDRITQVNGGTVMACSGDIADYQLVKKAVALKTHTEDLLDDGFKMRPSALHSWITRVMYNRRSNFNPLWNSYIVGGMERDRKPFLGFCNMIGVSYVDDCLATGFGSHLAIPLLRQRLDDKAGGKSENLTEDDARDAVIAALKQLYLRDCRASNAYQLAVVTADGVNLQGQLHLDCDWSVAEYVCGYE